MLVAEAELAERRQQHHPESVESLLERYFEAQAERGETWEPKGKIWEYLGIDGFSAYNSTVVIKGPDGGEMHLNRVEPPDEAGEDKCFVAAFKRVDDVTWKLDEAFEPIAKLQDPSYIHLPDGVGLSGVEIRRDPASEDLTYRKSFYFGPDIYHLSKEASISGSEGEKGQVIKPRRTGKLTVFTRPQGGNFGRGRVGFREFDDLSNITGPESFKNAPIIAELFGDEEWGGVDQVLELSGTDNRLLAIGHIARFTENEKRKHYYPIAFVYDADSGDVSELTIIATRKDFPQGPAKSAMLEDVVYPRGLYLKHNRFILVAGLSDMQNGELDVTDRLPVLPYLA